MLTIIDLIPSGKECAISRERLVQKADLAGLIPHEVKDKDRYVRLLISEARNHDVIVSKPSGGYYVPKAADLPELQIYVKQEKARAFDILATVSYAERVCEDLIHGRITEIKREVKHDS